MTTTRAFAVFAALFALSAGSGHAQTQDPAGATETETPAPQTATENKAPPATSLTALTDAKKIVDAETELYKSQDAAAKAKAALKATKDGPITGQSGITGLVTATDSPKGEALLLMSRAANSAGGIIATRLSAFVTSEQVKANGVLLVTSKDELSTASYVSYDTRRSILLAQLQAAHQRFIVLTSLDVTPKAAKAEEETQNPRASSRNRNVLALASGADQVLSALTKVGSWFQSDYTFVAANAEPPSDLYAAAVAQHLAPKTTLYTATGVGRTQRDETVKELTALQAAYQQAATDQDLASRLGAQRKGQAADNKDQAIELQAAATRWEAYAATTDALLKATDAFANALFTATAEKPAPIVQVIREREVDLRLQQRAYVLLVSGKSVGAYYTKKNLWTFVGGPPLYTMGGVSVQYRLFSPSTGQLFDEGAVPIHGGYHSVNTVAKLFPAR